MAYRPACAPYAGNRLAGVTGGAPNLVANRILRVLDLESDFGRSGYGENSVVIVIFGDNAERGCGHNRMPRSLSIMIGKYVPPTPPSLKNLLLNPITPAGSNSVVPVQTAVCFKTPST